MKAGGRRQEAGGRRQKEEGRRKKLRRKNLTLSEFSAFDISATFPSTSIYTVDVYQNN
ncbi:MAG: hypothetical protein F6K25_24810 [Okeania sp. SIO2G4]|uniref:hypothetical protein n=1 Tax=unclassified Okeania TaxID=2634635 RepID=UPI0013BE4E65|nr:MULTISPECIES: hypothetical protein [unclassified Okeania]NEP74867.1 hypothetical protein [Okeania sp. SIO2G5]NEP96768.1 hypothetical protein [Okeania sp. SIO2F5]NEQ93703.1 hypothetical protein [Okeania sp. SIO2G4]